MTRSGWWRVPWCARAVSRRSGVHVRCSPLRRLAVSVLYLYLAAGLACARGERAGGGSATGGNPAGATKSAAASETPDSTDSSEAEGIAEPGPGADSAAERSFGEARPESKSGIEGRIVIGPACPVVEPDRPCPDKVYRAELTVRHAETGDVAGVVAGDAEGYFRIDLPPGSYVVDPGVPRLVTEPRAEPVAVEVRAGQYAQVVVRFDSGVR